MLSKLVPGLQWGVFDLSEVETMSLYLLIQNRNFKAPPIHKIMVNYSIFVLNIRFHYLNESR